MKALDPCDIDLSRLNPTPHAIAVYASSPLSPAVTQHSLPSGRYPLLGPDFHRLDHTSLRLAHSFDHLVGAGEELGRHFEAKRFSGLEVDDKFEDSRLHDRQVSRLFALENPTDVDARLPDAFAHVCGIADKTTRNRKRWSAPDDRKLVARR